MTTTSKKLKARRKQTMKTILSKTPEKIEKSEFKKTLTRMSLVNIKTHHSGMRIQRNDPCFCGSKKKFKYCCYHKHATLPASESRELRKSQEKAQAYFDKHRKLG